MLCVHLLAPQGVVDVPCPRPGCGTPSHATLFGCELHGECVACWRPNAVARQAWDKKPRPRLCCDCTDKTPRAMLH